MEKKCSKCNVVRDVREFNKAKESKDGLRGECKMCRKEINRIYKQANKERLSKYNLEYKNTNKERLSKYNFEYKNTNKESIAKQRKEYTEANREKLLIIYKDYREANNEKVLKATKKWRESNKDKASEYNNNYVKSRRKSDNLFRLKLSVRNAVVRYLVNGKSKGTPKILGLDYKEFQDYLEIEYIEGMHLDHIVPLSWANNDEEVYILNHYSNFQIITAEENLSKSDRYCKSENLNKVTDNHNNLTKLNEIIKRNKDKIK